MFQVPKMNRCQRLCAVEARWTVIEIVCLNNVSFLLFKFEITSVHFCLLRRQFLSQLEPFYNFLAFEHEAGKHFHIHEVTTLSSLSSNQCREFISDSLKKLM